MNNASTSSAIDPLEPVPAACEERWLEVDDGVSLRSWRWTPHDVLEPEPLVFVAGWVSVVEGWRPVLRELVVRRPVIYLETREKASARIDRSRLRVASFTVDRLARDLVAAAEALSIPRRDAVWFGSSMGSNAILEALKGGRLPARGAFLVGPNSSFRVPAWGRPILYLPAGLYHLIRPFVVWYLRRFRVDAKAEPEQMERYERTLNAADPLRLKLSARAILDYAVWPGLDSIEVPVTIAYAPTDTLHSEREVEGIVGAMSSGRALECPSNAYMHDPRLIVDLERFITELR